MLEETTPRHSLKWVPRSTFAAGLGMADHGMDKGDAPIQTVEELGSEKSTV